MHQNQSTERAAAQSPPKDAVSGYDAERARVDEAFRLLRAVTAAGGAPGEVRAAARTLSQALHDAKATVVSTLRELNEEAPPPPPRRWRRRRLANRTVPAEFAAWSAELVRLTEIDGCLARATLDVLGVHVPTTVQGGSAITGPGNAESRADPDRGVVPRQRRAPNGLDLGAIVNAYRPPPSGVVTPVSPAVLQGHVERT